MANKTESNGTGTSIVSMFEQVAETGFGEVQAEDLRTPRISIIQALSPQRKKDSSEYQPDAEEGDIFFSGTNTVVNGSEGLGFIPVWYDKTLVEWKLREKGGGLVNVHGSNSDIINRCQRDSQGRLITPSGETQITTTANHYGFALIDGVPTKCVINMTGSQLKHSRYFNTLIQGTKIEGSKGLFTPPSYSHVYSLKTQPESNDRGSWYSYDISQDRPLNEKEAELFNEAKDFAEFCAGGGMNSIGGPSSSAAIEDKSSKTEETGLY